MPMIDASDAPSTRPYLLRALYEWCSDNGFTPYVAVMVDDSVRVPMEYVKDGEIVLNISLDATNGLKLGNEYIEFKGRFGGVARDIVVPVGRVMAIYARENGQGMAFPVEARAATSAPVESKLPATPSVVTLTSVSSSPASPTEGSSGPDAPRPQGSGGNRPSLTRVK